MTRKQVGSQILTLVSSKTELVVPASAINDLVVNAKRELVGSLNEWVNNGTADRLKGALFLLQTAGTISVQELEATTDLINGAE